MPIKVGTNTPSDFKVGNSQVDKIFLGTNLVWPLVTLFDSNVTAAAVGATEATVRLRINTSGIQETKEGTASYTTVGMWLNGGVASDYEVRLTIDSTSGSGNTVGSATYGIWIDASTSPEWLAVASPWGYYTINGTLEIRTVSDSVVRGTASIVLVSDRA